MRHIVILDDKSKQNKAFLEIARVLNGVKILTEPQWEVIEDEFTIHEINKGLKTPPVSKSEVKKALKKMRS